MKSKAQTSPQPEFATLKYEVDGAAATITLNRPEKRNAMSSEMVKELLEALGTAESDSSTHVLILTGAGKAFCSGMDLETLQTISTQTRAENLGDSRELARLFHRIYCFPKPVITAVNGAAIAGGCGIATFSDITLAVPDAKFGYTEVRIGFIPALVSVLLRRQIGEKHAREILLTGRIFDTAEGYRLGLITEIVPCADLMKRAREFVDVFRRRVRRVCGEPSGCCCVTTKTKLRRRSSWLHRKMRRFAGPRIFARVWRRFWRNASRIGRGAEEPGRRRGFFVARANLVARIFCSLGFCTKSRSLPAAGRPRCARDDTRFFCGF